jgi:hypothetical protein
MTQQVEHSTSDVMCITVKTQAHQKYCIKLPSGYVFCFVLIFVLVLALMSQALYH